MKLRLFFSIVGLLPVALAAADTTPPRPNIIFIITDDLGYGDIGALFQNQRQATGDRAEPWHFTPRLDELAGQGMRLLDQYCAAPVCAPSRASLLTGVTQGHANVRNNQFDKALADNHTLASVLRGAGYATAAFGKWGLQGTEPSKNGPADWPAHPTRRGFDYYFGYISHSAGHSHYPKEDKQTFWENNANIAPELDLCYTTDLLTARAKKWIEDHRRSAATQPFFIYLAYDTPHARLENPPCPYPAGGGLSGGVRWLGTPHHMINTATGEMDGWMHPDYRNATWDHDRDPASAEVPWPDVNRRYANDVRRIDDAVGDLMQLLADLQIDRNTLVVFTSDNGPSIESGMKGNDANGFTYNYTPDFFNSFGPFDGIKRDLWEGGVRMPVLVRWPARIAPGSTSHTPSGSWDWLPTFAQLAGVPAPCRTDGVSLQPTLTGEGAQDPSRIYVEYFHDARTPRFAEFLPGHRNRLRNQMQLVRLGKYLGVRYDIKSADDEFEIYDVANDLQESTNLASRPEFAPLAREMKAVVLGSRRPDGEAPRPYDEAPVPAVEETASAPGVDWSVYRGSWPWLPKFDYLRPEASGRATRADLTELPSGPADGVLFQGFIAVPVTGEYTFHLATDGRVFLRLHDCQVIDGDFGHPAGGAFSGTIRLEAGRHPFRLYYARNGASPSPALSLEWSGPQFDRQSIPAGVFFRRQPARPGAN